MQTLDPTVVGNLGPGLRRVRQRERRQRLRLDRTLAGFAAGLDVRLPSGIKLGVVGGYTENTLDTNGRFQSAGVTSGFGGVYGGYEIGPVSLRLGAVYADESLRTRRAVIFPGVRTPPPAATAATRCRASARSVQVLPRSARSGGVVSRRARPPAGAAFRTYIEPFVGGAYVGIHGTASPRPAAWRPCAASPATTTSAP